MAYFSNGTEGEDWQSKNCENCWHDRNEDCPVFLIHLEYNYKQNEKTDKGKTIKKILNELVPNIKKGLFAGPCSMKVSTNIINGEIK